MDGIVLIKRESHNFLTKNKINFLFKHTSINIMHQQDKLILLNRIIMLPLIIKLPTTVKSLFALQMFLLIQVSFLRA
jgi:hypothetical protein